MVVVLSYNRWRGVVIVAVVGGVLAGCAKDDTQAGRKRPPQIVGAMPAKTEEFAPHLIALGTVTPLQSVAVRPRSDGEITRILFREGDDVRAGQPLFQLDDRAARAQLAQARANLASARATAMQARGDLTRAQALVGKGFVSGSVLDQRRAQSGTADAGIAAAQAAVQATETALSFQTIRAPVSGRTGEIAFRLGANVRNGEAMPLVTVNQLSPISVRFLIPPDHVDDVRGAMAKGAVTVTARAKGGAASAPPLATGRLRFLDNNVGAGTGSVAAKAEFVNSGDRLWPGAIVNVELPLADAVPRIVLPEAAVQTGRDMPFVWTIGAGNKIAMRDVTVAGRSDGKVFLTSGVEPGENVIVDTLTKLRPGDAVRTRAGRSGLMSIVRLSVERPVATVLLSLAIIFAGIFGYRQLPVSALPEVDLPTIQISANLPGANPGTMASSVATPIERQLSTISGIDMITSSSSTGSTNITVQFALDRDIDAAALDVQSALSAVTRRLPREMPSPPTFRKVNPADQPVLILSVRDKTRPANELQTIVDTLLVPRISTMTGVGEIQTYGSRRYAMRVQFDPAALTARNLTSDDVRSAIASANSNVAVGSITGGDRSYILDATGNLETPDDFAAIIVASRDGLPVRLGDIAKVSASYEQLRGGAKFNGEPSLTLAITRQPGANVVKLVDDVLGVLPSVRNTLPTSVTIMPIVDRSESVRDSVTDAQYTLVGTAILVILVIYLVLGDWRATIIPAVVLPLAAVGTFAGMYFFNFNLDNLSLLALTLATGFVVDDAIVVLENIVRHIEDGEDPRTAAVTGANEIAFTVLSISVSLVAVFIPLLFMGGIIGRLFFEFAVTMTIAIGISAVLSLTLIPMIAARVLKPGHQGEGSRTARASTRAFGRLQARYLSAFDATLRHRKLVGIMTVASIGVAVWGFTVVPKGFFPVEDTGAIFVGTEGAPDIGFEAMQKKQDAIARIVRADPAVARVNSFVGGGGSNIGRMFAPLVPRSERDAAEVVQARLRKKLSNIPGISAFPNIPQNLQMGGRQSSANYQYTLSSADKDALYDFAPQLEAKLRATAGFEDVSSDYQRGARELMVDIDRDAAARLGVSVAAIRQALYSAYGNQEVSTIYTDADSYSVILEIDPAQQLTPDALGQLTVRAGNGDGTPGQLVPLSAVTTQTIKGAPSVVAHQSQLPAVTLSFNLAKSVALSQAQPLIDAAAAELEQPAAISGAFGGNAQQFDASTKSMPLLFLAAIIVIYIVLGVLYESFVHPITILSGLPAAGIGAVAFLWLFNKPLDVIGIIGVVLLIGIVKKNAIMMIDFALAGQRAHGWTPVHAIREAASKRFRPIMMTTFAAMAAAAPLALGLGAGAELRQPLGIAVLGGLMVSQVLTLFITPVVYLGIEGLNARMRARRGAADVRELPTVIVSAERAAAE